ncbi:hypothetical protein RJ639_023547 [Escallonia herrerae]|uniref:Uncharacterized protein n=1 Tax=Escallonia herrerae TaxID=1293975 RepID=A0AA88UZN9_9ASTE|nr:hypothetical protein RJ639_023547 [Escallonia herrerae]
METRNAHFFEDVFPYKVAQERSSLEEDDPRLPVNLRTRMRPVLPKSSIGNLIWFAFAQHMPDTKLEFPCIVGRIRKAFAKVECLKEYAESLHNIDMDNCLVLTSLRKTSIYEVDFGWGKPSCCYFCNPGFKSVVVLMDTSGMKGYGFEKEPEIRGCFVPRGVIFHNSYSCAKEEGNLGAWAACCEGSWARGRLRGLLLWCVSSVSGKVTVDNALRGQKEGVDQRWTTLCRGVKSDFSRSFAKLRDDLNYIDCNDEGVYYVEAKVSYGLKEFLSQPDVQLIQLLTPNNPLPLESMSGNYVFLVQVNIFDCGGIAIGTCASHKIADGATFSAFMNAWSRLAACGSLEEVHNPSFIAPSLFPPNSSVLCKWPFKESKKNESVTRRFVFHGTALAALRAQAASISHVQYPTSVEAVAALIWSCAIEAISKVTNKGPKQASIFAVPVNLRTRMRQVLPKSSMGNLVWFAFAQHMPDAKLEFPCIVDCIRKVFAKVDNDFIEGIKGKEGYAKVSECLKEYAELLHNIDMDNCLILTSLRKAGITEIDFGWGKPSWYYFCNPGFKNFVFLMDTRSGDGIEALVSLSGQAMAIFERDPKLLVYASVDPCPL